MIYYFSCIRRIAVLLCVTGSLICCDRQPSQQTELEGIASENRANREQLRKLSEEMSNKLELLELKYSENLKSNPEKRDELLSRYIRESEMLKEEYDERSSQIFHEALERMQNQDIDSSKEDNSGEDVRSDPVNE